MSKPVYHRPKRLEDAIRLLNQNAAAKILAGGQDLIPRVTRRELEVSHYIDIQNLIDLRGVAISDTGIRIGVAETHRSVSENADVRKTLPVLAKVAGEIGDLQTRNRGTIGGALLTDHWRSDYHGVFRAIGLCIETDRRKIDVETFYQSPAGTVLASDEIAIAIHLNTSPNAAYLKQAQTAIGYARVGIFAAIVRDTQLQIALLIDKNQPSRLRQFENTDLISQKTDLSHLVNALNIDPQFDYEAAVAANLLSDCLNSLKPIQ